jgi:hypothetical protein
MGETVEGFEEVAAAGNCGVNISHHFRKGNSNDTTIDSLRGAVATVDAARSVELLEMMTEKAAEDFNIEPERRKYFFRSFSGKINFAPPSDRSDWFERVNVMLDNGTTPLTGDNVPVVVRWQPPDTSIALPRETIEAIKEEVRRGDWREHPTASAWVGRAVAKVLKLDIDTQREAINKMLKHLIGMRVLETVLEKDQTRQARMYVRVVNG